MAEFDVVILGAGAAGMMCAMEAGKRGRRVLLLDHADRAGKKILISGGGRSGLGRSGIVSSGAFQTNSMWKTGWILIVAGRSSSTLTGGMARLTGNGPSHLSSSFFIGWSVLMFRVSK